MITAEMIGKSSTDGGSLNLVKGNQGIDARAPANPTTSMRSADLCKCRTVIVLINPRRGSGIID